MDYRQKMWHYRYKFYPEPMPKTITAKSGKYMFEATNTPGHTQF